MFFFTDDMIVCVEKSKRTDKNLLKLMSIYIKVAGYMLVVKNQLLSEQGRASIKGTDSGQG